MHLWQWNDYIKTIEASLICKMQCFVKQAESMKYHTLLTLRVCSTRAVNTIIMFLHKYHSVSLSTEIDSRVTWPPCSLCLILVMQLQKRQPHGANCDADLWLLNVFHSGHQNFFKGSNKSTVIYSKLSWSKQPTES